MGFILQILALRSGKKSVEDDVNRLVRSGQSLLKALEHERELEEQLTGAEKRGELDEIFRIQKKEIKLAMEAIQDIRNIQMDLFALGDDERRQIDDFILDAKRLLLEGVPSHEEKGLIEKLKRQKKAISSFLKARYKG